MRLSTEALRQRRQCSDGRHRLRAISGAKRVNSSFPSAARWRHLREAGHAAAKKGASKRGRRKSWLAACARPKGRARDRLK
eukprot:2169340-Pyramimonas_sp.AAC.1